MVIAAIQDRYGDGRTAEGASGVEPSEATADDYDLREWSSFIHADDEMILRFARGLLVRNSRQPYTERSKLIA